MICSRPSRRIIYSAAVFWLGFFFGGLTAAADQVSVPEDAYGKVIDSIEFETPVNQSYGELMFGLPIRRTNRLHPGDIEASIEALRVRQIFGEINVRVENTAGNPPGVRIVFDLPPASTVSDSIFRGYHLLDEQRLRRLAGLRLGTSIPIEVIEAAVQRI